jgi:hypothetical protein
MDPVVARKCWRTLEPYHGLVYFTPEATAAYNAIGLEPGQHYFASRAAALGPVPAEVVIATFFNFHPALVRAAIPSAWDVASPEAILAARVEGAGVGLRLAVGEALVSPELKEALELARVAAEVAVEDPAGRPLFAAHAALAWPADPVVALWHAIALLREYRGDGHIAVLVAEGVGPCEALVIHGATGEVPSAVLQASRAWPDDEWAAAEERLRQRGWLDADGALTDAGRAHRQWVEDRTDQNALKPWAALGDVGAARLRALVRPWSRAISESGAFGRLRPR